MSFWAQGFEPRTDRAAAQCGPGTKNCGKICIAQNAECHIGKGKVGIAQTLGGAALFGAGVAAASQGNNAVAAGLVAGGLGLYTRGQYNIGRSAGHSTVGGAIGKYAVGVQPTPLGLGAAALGTINAQKSIRPSVDYPVGVDFIPQRDKNYSVMSQEEYEAHQKEAGVNTKKPVAVDKWGYYIFERNKPKNRSRFNYPLGYPEIAPGSVTGQYGKSRNMQRAEALRAKAELRALRARELRKQHQPELERELNNMAALVQEGPRPTSQFKASLGYPRVKPNALRGRISSEKLPTGVYQGYGFGVR